MNDTDLASPITPNLTLPTSEEGSPPDTPLIEEDSTPPAVEDKNEEVVVCMGDIISEPLPSPPQAKGPALQSCVSDTSQHAVKGKLSIISSQRSLI